MSEIIHKTPGTRGYRLGCRCDECRAAQTAKQAERRARKADLGAAPPVVRPVGPGPVPNSSAGRVAPPDVTASPDDVEPPERVAGKTELRVIAEIESLWRPGWNAECDVWEEQALDAARRLDDGPATTHVAPLTRLKNEALRELRRLMKPPAPTEGAGAGPVRDDFTDYLGETHVPSGFCQPTWPVVVPGHCEFCDAHARFLARDGR